MSTRILPFVVLLLFLSACAGGCRQPPIPPPISPDEPVGSAGSSSGEGQGIGDIETSLRYEILLSPESVADNIIYDEKMNMLEFVSSVTIHVGAPQPEELWLNSTVRSVNGFRGHTVLIKPRMFLSGGDGFERKTIELDEVIMSDTAIRDVNIQRIDLLKHLDEIPEWVRVTGKLDIYYFKNTALADADLENLDSFPADMRTVVSANPARVNFNF